MPPPSATGSFGHPSPAEFPVRTRSFVAVFLALLSAPGVLASQAGPVAPQPFLCSSRPLGSGAGLVRERLARTPDQAQMPERDFRLFAAVAEGANHVEVERLLREGASAEASDGAGETALSMAARFDNPSAAIALLAAGASPNRRNVNGMSLLALASLCGQEQVVIALLAKGAVVNEEGAPVPPLMAAAVTGRERIVRELLARGADIGLRNTTGVTAVAANAAAFVRRTMGPSAVDSIVSTVPAAVRLSISALFRRAPATAALLRAAKANDLAGTRAALSAGGDPLFHGLTEPSALGVAVNLDNAAMVRAMLSAAGTDLVAKAEDLETNRPRARSAEVLGLLVTAGPKPAGEPRERLLEWVVKTGSPALVRGLLEPGSGITAADVIAAAIVGRNVVVAEALIAGPDTSWFAAAGDLAITASGTGTEALLLEITRRAGRNADRRLRSGPPTLHYAVMEHRASLLEAVLNAGADPNVAYDGMSLLLHAYRRFPSAVPLLRARGAAASGSDGALVAAVIDADDGEEMAILMRDGLDVYGSRAGSASLLQRAIELGKGAVVRAMLADAGVAARVTGASDRGYALVERAATSPSAGYGRATVLGALLAIGAPAVPPDRPGLSPIVASAAQDLTASALTLLVGAKVPATGVTPGGNSAACLAFRAWADRRDQTPVYLPTKLEETKYIVLAALEGGTDLNVATCELPGGTRGTILHLIAQRGTTNITERYRDRREDEAAFVRFLLDQGADPRIKSSAGLRAEDLARERKDERLVAILRAAHPR